MNKKFNKYDAHALLFLILPFLYPFQFIVAKFENIAEVSAYRLMHSRWNWLYIFFSKSFKILSIRPWTQTDLSELKRN